MMLLEVSEMPRARRVHFDGAVYHVYNRLARGERVFGDDGVAAGFVRLLLEVVERDGLTVFAWALLPNHFHLAVRVGAVPLGRSMKTLAWRTTRRVNRESGVYGPLWQGRYRAKLVRDQRYLDQLLAYIHLNPVVAGLVEDPARYRWSGHRDVLGLWWKPIVEVDEVLRLFGTTRSSARRAYTRTLRGVREEEWIGEEPGRLPWWRLGRLPREEREDPDAPGRAKREEEVLRSLRERPALDAEELVARASEALGFEPGELASRSRGGELSRARELLAVVAVERYGVKVKDLAEVLHKHPVTVSGWVMRGTRRRTEDAEAAASLDALDRKLCGEDGRKD